MDIETVILKPTELDKAADFLRAGECVAFPTETVYGLGANALNPQAVNKVFLAKGRPQDNPLIVHCHGQTQVEDFVSHIPPDAYRLMEAFWPGPLTLVLPRADLIPATVSAGLDTVAVRVPDHPVALELLRTVNLPIAAPSANVSGRPSPTKAEHVWGDLGGRIRAIVDGGETGWGVESTVLDCTTHPFQLLRPGGVTFEQLIEICEVHVDQGVYGEVEGTPRSPGMKYKHYAPNAQVILVVGAHMTERIIELAEQYRALGRHVGIMALSEHIHLYQAFTNFDMGSKQVLQEVSSRLYGILRAADKLGVEVLLAEGVPDTGLGMAIMNRLRKAAGYNILET